MKKTPQKGPGRPKLDGDNDTVRINVRLTLPQRDFFNTIGGAPAFRAWLDSKKKKLQKIE